MIAAIASIVALIVGAVVLGFWQPDSWSKEVRAGVAINLTLVAALIGVAKVLFNVVPMSNRRRNWVRLWLLGVAIASLVAAVLVGWRLPGKLSHDWRPVLIVVASLLGLMIATLVVGLLPKDYRDWLRKRKGWGAVVVVLLPTTAIVFALVYRDIPAWARLVLAISALVLILVARLWNQAAWPDVAIVGLVALAITAAFIAPFSSSAAQSGTTAADKVKFGIDAKKHDLTVLERVEKNKDAVFLLVDPVKADDESAISYESTRYQVTVGEDLAIDEKPSIVHVELERGADDVSASTFGADLQAARKIYVLSVSG